MKIQLLYTNDYIPFFLYFYSIYKYFSEKNVTISFINNVSLIDCDTNIVFMFLNYIHLIYNKPINTNTKVIFINADYMINHTSEAQIYFKNYVNHINKNTYVWEYSSLNIDHYNSYFKNYFYIPLLYSNYLEELYNTHVKKIPYNEKKIDILFLAHMSHRRQTILNSFNKKYNIKIINHIQNIADYINIVENSKIIINIYSKETNRPFDYYRFALLYSNKIFVITEPPVNININLEPNLALYKEWMTIIDIQNMETDLQLYLNKTEEEVNIITENAYNNFKKYNMINYMDNFFNKFNN